jgi:hypothetical protein
LKGGGVRMPRIERGVHRSCDSTAPLRLETGSSVQSRAGGASPIGSGGHACDEPLGANYHDASSALPCMRAGPGLHITPGYRWKPGDSIPGSASGGRLSRRCGPHRQGVREALLRRHPSGPPGNVQVSARNGWVTLSGSVIRDTVRGRMGQVAKSVNGVERVVNLLVVVPE